MTEKLTLVLTDLVDSTRLNDELGDAKMMALWAEHDALSRELVRIWRGREVGRSDGFLLLFGSVADAVGFALAYHVALENLPVPLKARVGAHHGPVRLRHNSVHDIAAGATPFEVDGLALPTAARVMAMALGGQTLLTADAVRALGESPVRCVSHGHWRLKGLSEPIEVFELGGKGAPFTPPQDMPKAYRMVRDASGWTAVSQLPHNLPTERDGFIGRDPSLQAIAGAFERGARFLSLLGIGGIGKTRLSLRYARAWLGEYPGGAWFCDLSAARSMDGVVHAVAQALDVPLGPVDPQRQIAAAIRGRGPCLVILDNFEQVVQHAQASLGAWLDAAPQATFLVTSREVLGLVGEQTIVLEPLRHEEARALFLQRMQALAPARDDARDDERDLLVIDELVDLIDCLPLAIELSAARARLMSPREQLVRMADRFKLLAVRGGRHDRQATMRAALDWSWDLLSTTEQSGLAQLATFSSGFSIGAAEAVLEAGGIWVPDLLQSLVEKSWLRRSDAARLSMLATVQHYGAEHLARMARADGAQPSGAAGAARRHWQYFAQLTPMQATENRCVEIGNLMLGCQNALDAGDHTSAVRCLQGSWACIRLTGPLSSALRLAERVLSTDALAAQLRARTHCVAGSALYLMGRIEAARVELGKALQGSAGDLHLQAEAACALGELESTTGGAAHAGPLLRMALLDAQVLSDPVLQCRAHNALGALAGDQADWATAEIHYRSGLELARAQGLARWAGVLLGNLGTLHHSLGRAVPAEEHYEQAIAIAQALADRRGEGDRRSNLGLLRLEQGRLGEALEQLETALAIARSTGHVRLQGTVLCNLGLAWEACSKTAQSLEAFEAAAATAQSLRDSRTEGHYRIYLGRTQTREGRLASAAEDLGRAADLLMNSGNTQVVGLLHCAQAELDQAKGGVESASDHLLIARQMLLRADLGATSELGRELQRLAAHGIAGRDIPRQVP